MDDKQRTHEMLTAMPKASESIVIEVDKINEIKSTIQKAIVDFQWVTNGIKMNEAQHIRLGSSIVSLNDLIKTFWEVRSEEIINGLLYDWNWRNIFKQPIGCIFLWLSSRCRLG